MQIHQLSACELRERLERGELSSEEIVEALHRRADAINGAINALVHQFREEALERARAADAARAQGELWGPLHGLPVTVKESVDTRGTASTLGIERRSAAVATQDAVVVREARRAGAIVIGKTNVPQTLLSPMETLNALWGPTNNPWNPACGPGGSSGGEGAALAAGLGPLGIGTDIGGSIRIPAAYCGVCGLKPTVDRWSNSGSNTAVLGQEVIRAQIGPMARTSRDVALLFAAVDPVAQSRLDPRVPPLGVPASSDIALAGLRVGYYEDDGFFTPAASVRRAVREAVEALERRGAEIVRYSPPNAEEIVYLYFAALSSDGGRTLEGVLGGEPVIPPLKALRWTVRLPPAVRSGLSSALAVMGEHRTSKLVGNLGRKSVETLWALTARRTALQQEEIASWSRYGLDALVCPTHVTPAAPHGLAHDFTIAFCYVARYNLLNMPAGVVPVSRVRPDETHRTGLGDRLDRRAAQIEVASAGLPLGVQVVARPWREEVALAVMAAIEDEVRGAESFPTTPVDPPSHGGVSGTSTVA